MKRNEFVRFRETITNADAEHPIWYMGFLWLNLTEKQLHEIVAICSQHSACKRKVLNGRDCIVTPSGLGMSIIK